MKYLKYILGLCLVSLLLASCSKDDVTYDWTPVDNGAKAQLQLHYMAPVKNVAANYMYYVKLNNDPVYGNMGSSFLLPYNGIPSMRSGLFYTVDAGKLHLQLLSKDSTVVYDQTSDVKLKAGVQYSVVVYDLEKAPAVIECGEIPTFPGSAETANHCSTKWYNFLYDSIGQPSKDKLQLIWRGDSTLKYDEPMGKPIGFGEASEWVSPIITKTIYNSSGYQRRYYTFHVIDGTTGEDKGQLQVWNSKGKMYAWTDYFTWYIGRSYRLFIAGYVKSTNPRISVVRWTAY